LKSLIRAIDKFCLTHRRFGIPRLMLYVVIGSAAVFVISLMDRTGLFASYFAFWPDLILRGQVWRLVTWVFYPSSAGNLLFTAIALYFYYFIGSTLEREWGTPKFTIYYILGVLFNIIYGFAIYLITGRNLPITPEYLNLSLFFAFAVLYPDQRVMLFFIIPIKIKWLALVDAAFFVLSMIMNLVARQYAAAFLPLVAVLNFLAFFGSDLLGFLKPYKNRMSKQTIDFKKAARQYRQEEASRPYRHKCAVCGKTDTDNPTLEFRYCSRCNGYHCFCSEHINNHIHFQ
jgi:membrane associated rhomboid family serine protease